MTSFLHRLAEGLRTREQYLEEHSEHPIFEKEDGDKFKREYDDLVNELRDFSSRIKSLTEKGEDYDEHFERKISNENEQISIKIDSWAKGLSKE